MNYSAMIVAAAEELSDLLYSPTTFRAPDEGAAPAEGRKRIHTDIMDLLVPLLTVEPLPKPQTYEAYGRLVASFEGHVPPDRQIRSMYEDDHLTYHTDSRVMSHEIPQNLIDRMSNPLESPMRAQEGFLMWMTLLEFFRRPDIGGSRNSMTRKAVWNMQQHALRTLGRINKYRRSRAFAAERERLFGMIRVSDYPDLIQTLANNITSMMEGKPKGSLTTIPEWITGPAIKINFRFEDIRMNTSRIGDVVSQRPDDFTQMRLQEAKDPFAGEMDKLIGLHDAKNAFRNLQASLAHEEVLKALGVDTKGDEDVGHHLLFIGAPGTAKTTFARMVGSMYRELGILKKGHLVEVRRRDLVAEYIGQTAPKTRKKLDEAKDGVLFVDEAYELDGSSNDFGKEALTEIMGDMEDRRDRLVVIMAGYPDAMKNLLRLNMGLASRFRQEIYFDAYTLDELVGIFDLKANGAGLRITDETRMAVQDRIESDMQASDPNSFGNGRYVRNLVHATKQAMSARLYTSGVLTPMPANQGETRIEALRRIFKGSAQDTLVSPTPDDVRNARLLEQQVADSEPSIGFGAKLKDGRGGTAHRRAAAVAAPARGAMGGPS